MGSHWQYVSASTITPTAACHPLGVPPAESKGVRGEHLGGAGEEGLREDWEGVDGFGGGFVRKGLRGADRGAVAGL